MVAYEISWEKHFKVSGSLKALFLEYYFIIRFFHRGQISVLQHWGSVFLLGDCLHIVKIDQT